VKGTTPEAHLDSFPVGPDRYLVTSTEYQIKRLIAEGIPAIYTLGPNFRRGEQGERHNPEFTMLEWARVGVDLRPIEADAEALLLAAAGALEREGGLPLPGGLLSLETPFPRLGLLDAIERHLGLRAPLEPEPALLLPALAQAGLEVPPGWEEDGSALYSLLLDALQPRLGHDRPTFLVDWPAFLTASAPSRPDGLADRSELFAAGLELADGFPSLTDATEQRRTFARELARRASLCLPAVHLDQRYLAALDQGLPAGAGMALGVDRLVMLVLGCPHISEVLAFAWDEL
jgi:lysyl-tRNA synthetase class 2